MNQFIRFQDPSNEDSPSVLDALLEACETATVGGGIFAFASASGVSLLFKDEEFIRFLKRGQFHLIVGLDSITNELSLARLQEEAEKYPNLTVNAFLNPRIDTFHPKFCWFGSSSGGATVVGSGNLTQGGLVGNWEAFTHNRLGAADILQMAAEWKQWVNSHMAEIRPINDPQVIARAKQNKPNIIRVPDDDEQALSTPPPSQSNDEVLIADIPRASDRWGQANFNLDTFRGYFHLEPGTSRRIVLWHVDQYGNIGDAELRRSVSVKSHNFRIELAAAGDADYPTNGRPIAVFLRVGHRRFRYRLLFPSDPQHGNVEAVLTALGGPPNGTRLRRETLSNAELHRRWPATPL